MPTKALQIGLKALRAAFQRISWRVLDMERLNDAVLHKHRIALRADTQAAGRPVHLKPIDFAKSPLPSARKVTVSPSDFASLALFDAEHHADAIEIGDLERYHFGGPKPRAMGNAQHRLVLGAGSGLEQPGDLLLGQHSGQFLPGLAPGIAP